MTDQDIRTSEAAPAAIDAAGRIEPTLSAAPETPGSTDAVPSGETTTPEMTATPPAGEPAGEPETRPGQGLRGWGRNHRFALLAATMALSAASGAILGSLGLAGGAAMFAHAPKADTELVESLRALKNDVAALRSQIKATGDQVASLRTAVTTSGAAANAQLAKVSEALERADKRPVHSPSTEVTGSIARPQAAAKPLAGWVVRRVYDGIALIEGRDGIIEAEPGDSLPGLGQIQEIKRQNGRWVVVTSKGIVTSR